MGRVRAPLVVVLLWTGTGSAGNRASRGADGPVRRRDVPHRDLRRSGDCVAGDVADPRAASWSRCSSAAGLTASALGDFIWLAYTWAGLEPDVSLADIFYYAGYLGLGAAMLVIVLQAPSGRPARGRRRCHRRSHRGGGERVGPVERRRPRDRHRHVDVGDDARRPRGIPRDRRRAAGAGAPGPLGAPPPGGPGLPLRGRRGLLARLRPRLPPVPGLGHGVGPPRRGLDGRRHPDRHLHVASSASDARGRGARARADAPGTARPRHPPAPGPPGPARRHLRPRTRRSAPPRGSPGCSS